MVKITFVKQKRLQNKRGTLAMPQVEHFRYADQRWTVRSVMGVSPQIRELQAGAYELQFPFAVDEAIPMEFDASHRFIDRTPHFHTIVISEHDLWGRRELNLREVHECGKQMLAQATEVNPVPVFPEHLFSPRTLGGSAIQLGGLGY